MIPLKSIILGTRGSELALTQTSMVRAHLEAAWPGLEVQVEIIKTTGDLRPDLKLTEFNRGPNPLDKGIFTKELEEALRDGRIHAAVHSLKDVPTELAEGFAITTTLERAPVEDVLLTKSAGGLDDLPSGARVATSSVRRARQMKELRPDLEIVEIRGNVGTRIRKLAEDPGLHGTLLARAGLHRLGLEKDVLETPEGTVWQHRLPPHLLLPAASQGAVAIETYGSPAGLGELLAKINHLPTFQCILAERHFLHLLQAGCHTPVGIYSRISDGNLLLDAVVFTEASPTPLRSSATGALTNPKAVATQLFEKLSAA